MKSISAAQIKKIKVLQRQLDLEDGDYRAMLKSVAGVDSCKELAGPKIDRVIKHLERRAGGGKTGARGQGAVARKKLTSGPWALAPDLMATKDQIAKITALWQAVSRAPQEKRAAALRLFLRRRFRVDSLNRLTLEAAVRVIEGLKVMAAREGVLDD